MSVTECPVHHVQPPGHLHLNLFNLNSGMFSTITLLFITMSKSPEYLRAQTGPETCIPLELQFPGIFVPKNFQTLELWFYASDLERFKRNA